MKKLLIFRCQLQKLLIFVCVIGLLHLPKGRAAVKAEENKSHAVDEDEFIPCLISFLKAHPEEEKDSDFMLECLYDAAGYGQLDVVRFLVEEKGVNIDSTYGHHTALDSAIDLNLLKKRQMGALEDRIKVAEYLVYRGGRVSGFLFAATALKFLASKTTNEIFINTQDLQGNTLLHWIVGMNDEAVSVELNKTHEPGWDLKRIREKTEKDINELIEAGANIEFLNDEGLTPLQYARKFKNKTAIQVLLKRGAKNLSLPKSGGCAQQ